MSEIKFAKVQFVDDETISVVPIDKVKKFKKKRPQNDTDFKKSRIYSVYYRHPKKAEYDGYYEAKILELLSMLFLIN